LFLLHHQGLKPQRIRAGALLFGVLVTGKKLPAQLNTDSTIPIAHVNSGIYNVETREVGMKATIRKWGNSPALRISSSIMELAQLSVNQTVNINVVKGKIIVEPVAPKNTRLEDLLAGITSDNIHGEESFGQPVGKESL
jgi:antitoxin MazE